MTMGVRVYGKGEGWLTGRGRSKILKSRWESLSRVNWIQELKSLRIRDFDQELVDKGEWVIADDRRSKAGGT